MKRELYRYYRHFVLLGISVPILFFIVFGGAFLISGTEHNGQIGWSYRDAQSGKRRIKPAFIWAFVIMFVYTGFTIAWGRHFNLCPRCKKRSVQIELDPPSVTRVSPKWKEQENIAVCRQCGFRQKTDLVFISNMFVASFPIRVKEEDDDSEGTGERQAHVSQRNRR